MKNMGMKIIWTCGLLMLFLKGCFNGRLEDEYVTLLDKVEIWKGSCAVLQCQYRSKETYDKFIWLFNATYDVMNREFNGTTVYNNTEENDVDPLFAGRVQYVGKSNTDCTIVIRNIRKEDEGKYNLRLLSINKEKKWMSKTLTITVSDIGTTLKIHPLPEIKESETVTLNCSISYYCPLNNITLYWIEDVNGTSTIDAGNDTGEVQTTSTLTFRPSWRDNKKNITCVLNGDDGEANNTTIQLNVMHAPKNVQIFSNATIEIQRGRPLTLTCSVESSNPPDYSITWFRDNPPLQQSSKKGSADQLQVSNPGKYFCKAKNKFGEAKSNSVEVSVLYAPDKPVLKKYQDPIEGKDITLECSTKANPPVSRYVWFQDGDERYNHTSNQFTIYNIKENNSGSYTCLARNKLGEATSDNLDLNVMYAPKNVTLTVIPGDHVTEHMNVTLKCASSGNPARISYEFYVNNVSLGRDAGSFELNDVQIKDTGDYSCLATNLVGGRRSNVVFLHVSDSPATIGKFAIIGAFSFIVLLLVIIILNVRFRVRIRNALCRRTVDDKSESLFFVLKKPHESADNIGHQTPSIYSSTDQLNDSRVTFPAPSKEQSNLSSAMADKDVTTVNSVTGKVPNVHKYENIDSSERAHEDSQDESHSSIIANLNEKHKERVRDPEVEYASLGHS